LAYAQVEQTNFEGTEFRGVNFQGVDLKKAQMNGARIDIETYRKSAWSPECLLTLHQQGVIIDGFNMFPLDALNAIADNKEGLVLYFNTKLTFFDQFLVNGVIFGVLGRDTDCRVIDFKELNDAALVRLQASRISDLVCVAEALHKRVWEQQARAIRTEGTVGQTVNNQSAVQQQVNIQGPVSVNLTFPDAISDGIYKELSSLINLYLKRIDLREAGQINPSHTWNFPSSQEDVPDNQNTEEDEQKSK
jgi:hypothetical protein